MALKNFISNEFDYRFHLVHEVDVPIAAGHDRQERVGCGAGAICEPFPDPWWPDVPDGSSTVQRR